MLYMSGSKRKLQSIGGALTAKRYSRSSARWSMQEPLRPRKFLRRFGAPVEGSVRRLSRMQRFVPDAVTVGRE